MSKKRGLSHARIDAPHLADGLFVQTQGRRNDARKTRAEIQLGKIPAADGVAKLESRAITATWGQILIQFVCPDALSVMEQSVLLVLVARAGLYEKSRIAPDSKSQRGRELHALLKATDDMKDRAGCMVETTMKELLDDCHLSDCGDNRTSVDLALWRLGSVVVWIHDQETGAKGNSLMIGVRKVDDKIEIAMNHRIREALLSTGFTRISLTERAALKTGTAKLLHAFLSRWAGSGGERTIMLDTLAKHVWDDGLGGDKFRRCRRAKVLLAALDEIRATGAWTIGSAGTTLSVLHAKPCAEGRRNPSTRKAATKTEESRNSVRRGRRAESLVKSSASGYFAA